MQDYLPITLYKIGVIQFGKFTLKSGQTSSLYINLRKIISYPDLLRIVAQRMWDTMKIHSFDLVCGVPYTALPIATCFSLENHVPLIMRRKEKKEYGTKQMVEGVFTPGQQCLIIEDVITTGSSILETAREVEKSGLKVSHVIALIDREEGGKQTLEKNYTVHTVLSLSTLLQTLLHSSLPTPAEQDHIKQFLQERASA
jgi:orotate phosphoribosyltransferase